MVVTADVMSGLTIPILVEATTASCELAYPSVLIATDDGICSIFAVGITTVGMTVSMTVALVVVMADGCIIICGCICSGCCSS
ncbi:hypothetical protein D3C80_1949700 [compost metagenome]